VKGKILVGMVAVALIAVVVIAATRDEPTSSRASGDAASSSNDQSDDEPAATDDDPSVSESLLTPGSTSSNSDLVAAFYRQFERAMRRNDANVLFEHLHPLVVDRYGASVCRAFVDSLVKGDSVVQLLAIGPSEPFTWIADGLTTPIEQGVAVRVRGGPPGRSIEADDHVAVVDGTVRWFTDCGVAAQQPR
jgi:hypothetical protein